MPAARDFEQLERRIGHAFKDRELLLRALTHRSFSNENPETGRTDNERLEFLGDAVLDLIVAHLLIDRHPALREGELSMTRAQVVSEAGLTEIARELGLGNWLFLGRGEEQTGGRDRPSLLADALEALMGAVYLDGGFDAARKAVSGLFSSRLGEVEMPNFFDFKTRMQERVQARIQKTPDYTVIREFGPDHDKIFVVAVTINGREIARAGGKSKKEAEQNAAANALFLLDGAYEDLITGEGGPPSDEEPI